jgi:hypothetical protein
MRDLFSCRVSYSIKDQLHTFVEEEEGKNHWYLHRQPKLYNATCPGVTSSPSPVRHRPAGLNLRPLSLSPDRVMSAATGDLPTPKFAATPTKPPDLKSRTLATSTSLISSSSLPDGVLAKATALHRHSVVVPPAHASASMSFFRKVSVTESTSSTSSDPFEAPRK